MLRVPVYSGVLKQKNINKKGLCRQAKIARHRFAHVVAVNIHVMLLTIFKTVHHCMFELGLSLIFNLFRSFESFCSP